MGKGKRYRASDRTSRDAMDHLEGKVKDGQTSPIAEDLQRRQRVREQADRDRNERIRRARELAQGGSDGGDAA